MNLNSILIGFCNTSLIVEIKVYEKEIKEDKDKSLWIVDCLRAKKRMNRQ